ncbi:MAG: hypothetical protein K5656_11500 [Lachnospiraceae bacterium]|nr:hypothetical protein [Lachnospiraceae bacterium]
MFLGDTVLNIPTITRFSGGSTDEFKEHDIPKLKELNVEIVYPGHGVPGVLDTMLSGNMI